MDNTEQRPARAVAPPPDERRCTHIGTQKGPDERCPNYSIRGGRVCKFHGGANPVTKAAAQLRLLAASDVAIDVLFQAMEHAGWKEKVAAAFGVLDRAGFGTKSTVVHTTPDQDLSHLSSDELERRAIELADHIRANRAEAVFEQHPTTVPTSESVQ